MAEVEVRFGSAHIRERRLPQNVYFHSATQSRFMDLTNKIGQRLRAARQAQRLSLAALAARTDSLSKSRISNYEQGIRRMGLEEAQELAAALGTVTPTYLLCLDDAGPLSASERELVEHYRQADDRGRDTILRVAESQSSYRVVQGAFVEGEEVAGTI